MTTLGIHEKIKLLTRVLRNCGEDWAGNKEKKGAGVEDCLLVF